MLLETLSKIEALQPGIRPTDRVLADLGVDADGLHYFVTTDAIGNFDLDAADLASYLRSAIESVHTEPPEDLGGWQGVTMMLVKGDELIEGVGGWCCKKCELLVGVLDSPPDSCPICGAEAGK